LGGLIFDDKANRMSPSFTVKRGVRYRCYVSSALLKGHKSQAGSRPRISALKIEEIVMNALERATAPVNRWRAILEQSVGRVVVASDKIQIERKTGEGPIIVPQNVNIGGAEVQKVSSNRTDVQLLNALIQAHYWVRQLTAGLYRSVEDLARSVDLHPKVVRNRIRLAFLSPEITEAILSHSSRLSLGALYGRIPLAWNEQQIFLRMTKLQ
jgi:hypothetical protein